MKRLLSALAAAVLAPFSTFAISLSDITDNPDQYQKISENMEWVTYIDVNSIESLRYSPPYYTMRVNIYSVSFPNNLILEQTSIYNYDYNRSMETIMKQIYTENQKYSLHQTSEQLTQKINSAINSNTGIQVNETNTIFWDLNGNLIQEKPTSTSQTVEANSVGYSIAEAIFNKYYNQYF